MVEGMEPVNPLRKILANASWLTGGRIVGDLANLALFVILARTFGPEGIGIYAYALGIAGLTYAAVNLGLEDFAVRQCARIAYERRGALIGRLLLIQAIVVVPAGTAFVFLLQYGKHTDTVTVLLASLVSQQVFFAFSRTLFSPSFSLQKMAGPAIAESVTRLLGIGGSIAAVGVFHADLAATMIPLAASALVLVMYSAWSCSNECSEITFSVHWVDIKPIILESWPFAASLFLSIAAIRSNFIILSVTLGDSYTGIYASGIKLMEAAVIPLSFLGFAAYPRLSHLYDRSRDEFWRAGEKLIRVAVVIGALISWTLYYVAPVVVEPLLGEKFAASGPIVRSIAGLGILTSLGLILVRLLLASDKQHIRLVSQAITLVVLLVTTTLAISILGLYGAVIGLYVSAFLSVIIMSVALGPTFRRLIGKFYLMLVVALLVSVIATIMMEMILASQFWNALVSLTVFLAAASWLKIIPRTRQVLATITRW